MSTRIESKLNASYLGADVQIEGKIQTQGNLRVDGWFEGILEGEGEVIVGTSAKILGPIRAQSLIINGQVEGNICSRSKLAILANGQIRGEIYAPVGGLSIAKGAAVEGLFHGTNEPFPKASPILTPQESQPEAPLSFPTEPASPDSAALPATSASSVEVTPKLVEAPLNKAVKPTDLEASEIPKEKLKKRSAKTST